MIPKNWAYDAAVEIASYWSFGPGPDNYVTNEQREAIARNIERIIQSHCPFEPDVAYMKVETE